MKETIVLILQQRMDKCTKEQFWAVATLTGMNAFVVAQSDRLLLSISCLSVIAAITVATTYGVWFIFNRHRAYYRYRGSMAQTLRDEPDAPEFMKNPTATDLATRYSGIVFYESWVIGLYALSILTLM